MDKTLDTKQLNDIIQTSVEERSVEKLNLFLSSISDTTQNFNPRTLLNLLKLLKKDEEHEVKCLHVSCVMSCLQHFLDSNIDSSVWEQFAEEISKLCFHGLLVSTRLNNEVIMERSINTVKEIVESSQYLTDIVLTNILELLLNIAAEDILSNICLLMVLNLTGLMLEMSSLDTRYKIIPSVRDHVTKLSNFLLICGDYESQMCVMEILARCWPFIKKQHPKALFSTCPFILSYFNSYTFLQLDTECRLFLNQLNNSLGDKQLVYSIPCLHVQADGVSLKKPVNPLYKEFWVDFNTSSRSISLYYLVSQEGNWNILKLEVQNILQIFASNSLCKSKEGEIISAVKMEITLKVDSSISDILKMLKIYYRKTHEFAQLEKKIIYKIFGCRYKSAVSYTNMPMKKPGSSSTTPHTKLNEASDKIMKIKNVFTEAIPQVADKSEIDESDLIGPSQTLENNTEKQQISECKTTEQIVSGPHNSSKCSDSLANDTKWLNQNINSFAVKDFDGNDIFHQNLKLDWCNSEHVNLCETSDNCEIKVQSDGEHRKVEKHIELVTPKNKNNADFSKPEYKELTQTQNILSTKDQQMISNQGSDFAGNSKMDKQDTEQTDKSKFRLKNLKRRPLYSVEKANLSELVMSSQDNFSVPSPPLNKLKKPKPVVVRQRAVNPENITFSYITYKEKTKATDNILKENIFTDLHELENNDSGNEITGIQRTLSKEPSHKIKNLKCSSTYRDKKDEELNKTPESMMESPPFWGQSVFSNSFSSAKDVRVLKTYARKRPSKRCMRRINVIQPSDSDFEFFPTTDNSRKNTQTPNSKMESNFINTKSVYSDFSFSDEEKPLMKTSVQRRTKKKNIKRLTHTEKLNKLSVDPIKNVIHVNKNVVETMIFEEKEVKVSVNKIEVEPMIFEDLDPPSEEFVMFKSRQYKSSSSRKKMSKPIKND